MIDFSSVPSPAVERLSLYLRQLEQLSSAGIEKISSGKLAGMLNITDSKVRKDLAYFGQFGRPGVGYRVALLIEHLRHILGTDKTWNVVVVGAGDLGRALLRYRGFVKKGFQLIAAFDISAAKVGQHVGGVLVHHMDELPEIVRDNGVKLAVVAVPAEAAQGVAEVLCSAGVTGILNFAPTTLKTLPGVAIGMVDLAASLEQLLFRVRSQHLERH